MNVSNLANLFQQNSIFQHGRPLGQKLGQPPISDTLHRLSQNFLTAQGQGQDLRKRFDTLELSAEAASLPLRLSSFAPSCKNCSRAALVRSSSMETSSMHRGAHVHVPGHL